MNPKSSGGVYTVPHSGSASYNGSVTPAQEERVTNGKVWVSTPPGIPSINLRDPWGEDDAVTTTDTGTVTWDIPSWVPGGIKLTVAGFHSESGGVLCRGSIQVKLDGGITDSPLGIGSLIMTALSLVGLVWAGWPTR